MTYWVIVTILVLVVFPILLLFFIATTDEEDSFIERVGQALNNLFHAITGIVTGFVFELTEPREKKRLRLAKEDLATRNGYVYREHWSLRSRDEFKRYLIIDDKFKQSLDILGISEEDWTILATQLFYMGQIKEMSRNHSDYSMQNSKSDREYKLSCSDKYSVYDSELLKEALEYFQIPLQEWIDYGDTVIEMHGIHNSKLIKEYGYMTKLSPCKNNYHLF